MISFSYTVKPVLGGYLRIMAGGGGGKLRKTGSTEKRSYKNDVKRQFGSPKIFANRQVESKLPTYVQGCDVTQSDRI